MQDQTQAFREYSNSEESIKELIKAVEQHVKNKGNNLEKVKLMLKSGVDVNGKFKGLTALHHAAFFDNLEMVKLLVQHGVIAVSKTVVGMYNKIFGEKDAGPVFRGFTLESNRSV